jgi:GAF domain-containing protein
MSVDTPFHAGSYELALAELSKLNATGEPLAEVLARTVELAKSVLSVPIEASVTLIDSQGATTPAFTAQTAMELDETQYELGYGPCLAAAEAGQLVSIQDMAAESRWPQFTADAQNQGVASSLSVPLPVQRQVIGALNMYASAEHAFADGVVELAEQFGDYAAVAIAHTTLYMSNRELAAQMTPGDAVTRRD